jgi:hypothetical protein
MTHEILVKRTIYVSTCGKCGDRTIKDDNPPKERFHCDDWWPFVADSYTGPSLKR